MNAISFKKWVSTILLLAITISLCGCSTNRTAASQDEHLTTTTAFIVLNGANVPALNSSAIASFVDTPQDGDRSILIVPDGNPSITTFSFDSTAKNVTYATAESKKWYKEICTSIIDARPDDADTDLLSAILLAANELKASDTQARHLMLLCNGLNTAPMLNFAETPFWSDATSIDEIISQLLKLNYLSADLLEDVDVTWAYLTSTSGLQKSLSPSMESRLLSFWQAYFDALCFLPWWVSFLIVLVLTVMAALLLPSRHSVCWARMLSTFCLLPVMIKSLGFELLAVSLPTAILNIGFCLLLSYLTAPVLLELIFVSYLYQK